MEIANLRYLLVVGVTAFIFNYIKDILAVFVNIQCVNFLLALLKLKGISTTLIKLGMKFTEVNYLKHPGQGNV